MTTIDLKQDPAKQRILTARRLSLRLPVPARRFYRHGWQSWSLTTWTDTNVLIPIQKPDLLHPMQADPVYAKEKAHHGSWAGAVDLGQEIVLLGALNLDAHVRLDDNYLEGQYEKESGEWLILRGDETTVFSRYADELTKRFGNKPKKIPPRVWCSWYSLYTAIDEKILHRVFDELADLPFDVLQVDDGWQAAVGDWDANEKFPSGMPALAGKINSTGRKAGLWLAPLIAVKNSKLFQEHPGWFLRDKTGKLTSAGYNWGQQLYALDTTHPEVLDWLTALLQCVRAWGFDYVKLDFLYGGALPGMRHEDLSREAAYRKGVNVLREALGDAYLLACGAPILPTLGLCDALRIGPDVAGDWESRRDAVLLQNPTIPGTKNAIRTTLHRLWLKALVQLDPDVVYFRSTYCRLTHEQKQLQEALAKICGFKATSDLPGQLSVQERQELRRFLSITSRIERKGPRTYRIDGTEIDFSPALSLPGPPEGFSSLLSQLLAWMANQRWTHKLLHAINEREFARIKKTLGKTSPSS